MVHCKKAVKTGNNFENFRKFDKFMFFLHCSLLLFFQILALFVNIKWCSLNRNRHIESNRLNKKLITPPPKFVYIYFNFLNQTALINRI